MTALNWPSNLFPQATMFRIDARSLVGGTTITGAEQIAQSTSGIWRAALSSIALNNPARVRAYRALLAGLDGRYGTVLVPVHDKLRAPLSATTYNLTGSSSVNPAWKSLASDTLNTHVGEAIVNPTVEKFETEVIDIEALKWTALAKTGTATIVSDVTFTWAPTSGTIAVGDYVTLFSVRRKIETIVGTRHSFSPPINPTHVVTSGGVLSITGTATFVSSDSFNWAPSTGTPAVGNVVTIGGVDLTIVRISGTRHTFRPHVSQTRTLGTVSATANATVSAGATSIQINRATGAAIEAGMYFSVAGKLYMITAITGTAGNVFTCSFRPPARVSISSSTAIEMVNPTCEMRLASDDTGSLTLDHLSRSGNVSLEFVEAV